MTQLPVPIVTRAHDEASCILIIHVRELINLKKQVSWVEEIPAVVVAFRYLE